MAKSASDYQQPAKTGKSVTGKAKSPAQQEAEAKKSRVEFPIPQGLKVDGIEKGEEHDMLSTYGFDGEGNMCLKAIEGIPVTSKKAKAPKAEQADEEEDNADDAGDEDAEGEGSDESGSGDANQGNADTSNTDEVAPEFDGQQGGFVNAMSKKK